MPFDSNNAATYVNPVTGRIFSGEKNIAALAATGLGPHWATFVQWKSSGRIVRKGERGTVLFGRGFTFRVFEESQTQIPEAQPTAVEAMASPVDDDTRALASWYIGDAVRKLYWSGHADALDRDMAVRARAVEARRIGPAIVAICAYAVGLYQLGAFEQSERRILRKVETVKAAKPVRSTRGRGKARKVAEPQGTWQRHPVTGYSVRVPCGSVGQDIRDLIPFGRDPAMLAKVEREWRKHGRIGAANTLVGLDRDGRRDDAAHYRRGLASRRREAGEDAPRYNYGPQRPDLSVVLEAVTIDASGREHRAVL
jgi:hypothetical protein